MNVQSYGIDYHCMLMIFVLQDDVIDQLLLYLIGILQVHVFWVLLQILVHLNNQQLHQLV